LISELKVEANELVVPDEVAGRLPRYHSSRPGMLAWALRYLDAPNLDGGIVPLFPGAAREATVSAIEDMMHA
jgi:hypothetical protein